jgi:eukaryotic-like serine/threonine-protein kinase
MRVSPNGGTPELLVQAKESEFLLTPQVLPGGDAVLFTVVDASAIGTSWEEKSQIVVQSLKSRQRKTLVTGGADGRYLATGHLVYVYRGTLLAMPFDVARLEARGGPVPMVEGVRRLAGVGAAGASLAQFAVSANGTLAYVQGPSGSVAAGQRLVLADRVGQAEPLKLPAGSYETPRVSPDGKRLALTRDDDKEASIWIHDLSGAAADRRLTLSGTGRNRFAIWSPDGERVTFQSDRDGDAGIYWQRADGTSPAERLTKAEQGTSHIPESWSPKGDVLLYSVASKSDYALWTLSLPGKTAAAFNGVNSATPLNAVFSPDGRWVAYQSGDFSRAVVYLQAFPPTGTPFQISKVDEDGHHPVWSRDGRELFYIPGPGRLLGVRVTTQPTVTFGEPETIARGFTEGTNPLLQRGFDVTPDGRFVGIVVANSSSAEAVRVSPIQIVLNWTEELLQRIPVPPAK